MDASTCDVEVRRERIAQARRSAIGGSEIGAKAVFGTESCEIRTQASAAAVGCDLRVGSDRAAVERENPLSETLVEPTDQGAVQLVSSFADRQDRHAVAKLRLAHRRQVHLLSVALGKAGRLGGVGSGRMSAKATFVSMANISAAQKKSGG